MASSELRARLANKNPVPAISLCGQNASMEITTDKVSIRWYARFRLKGFKGCQGNTFLVSVTNFQSWIKCCCMESPLWQITSIWKKMHYQLTKKHVVDLGCVLTCRTIFRSKTVFSFKKCIYINIMVAQKPCPRRMALTWMVIGTTVLVFVTATLLTVLLTERWLSMWFIINLIFSEWMMPLLLFWFRFQSNTLEW